MKLLKLLKAAFDYLMEGAVIAGLAEAGADAALFPDRK